jgi:hypothetical protein
VATQDIKYRVSATDNASSVFRGVGGAITAASAAAAAMGAAMAAALKAAADQQTIMNRLRFSVERAGVGYEGVREQIDAVLDSQQRLTRFGDTETAQALQQLVDLTGDLQGSLKGVTLAQDIAEASGKGLETSIQVVARAMLGQTEGLTRILPQLKDYEKELKAASGSAERAQIIMGVLNETYKGQAQTIAPFAQATARLANEMSDLQEAVGDLLSEALKPERSLFTLADSMRFLRDEIVDLTPKMPGFVDELRGLAVQLIKIAAVAPGFGKIAPFLEVALQTEAEFAQQQAARIGAGEVEVTAPGGRPLKTRTMRPGGRRGAGGDGGGAGGGGDPLAGIGLPSATPPGEGGILEAILFEPPVQQISFIQEMTNAMIGYREVAIETGAALEGLLLPAFEDVGNFAQGQLTEAFVQLTTSNKLLGDSAMKSASQFAGAVLKKLQSTLAGIATESAINALKETAFGFATLFTNPAESAAHFQAAGLFAATAAAAGGGAAAIGAIRPAAAGEGARAGAAAGTGGGAFPGIGPRDRDEDRERTIVINVNTSGAEDDALAPALMRALFRAVEVGHELPAPRGV